MISQLETMLQKLPRLSTTINRCAKAISFDGSKPYWERRYARGGNSGAGSYGRLASYKAETINHFVDVHGIQSVIEFGCGDGNQLSLARYPNYVGIDVAQTAIDLCRKRFAEDRTKQFELCDSGQTVSDGKSRRAELALSLDVIYHLVEDDVFENYMANLFDSAERFVIVYSSNIDSVPISPHVRHRQFTRWVATYRTDWTLIRHLPNTFPFDVHQASISSFADFFVFARRDR